MKKSNIDEKKSKLNTDQPTNHNKTSELEPTPTDEAADTIKNNSMNEKKSELKTQQSPKTNNNNQQTNKIWNP